MVEAKAITDSKMDSGKMDPFFVVMSILSPSLYNRIPKRNRRGIDNTITVIFLRLKVVKRN